MVRRLRDFLVELKRRKVYQVAVVYLVVAVGGLEVADVLVPATTLPEWSEEFFVVLAIVGFPVVVVLAWAFDITPEGVQRETGATTGPDHGVGVVSSAPTTPEAPAADRPPPSDSAETVAADAVPTGGAPPVGAESAGASSSAGPTEVETPAELDSRAIAVLPFSNLSDDPEAEPFCAGLHDDLLTELSRASALTVISRTSVQRYRGTTQAMTEIGGELGAGTIVEGGVQKAGDRVRLNVQLIDARSDIHLWAERYDRELSTENIFDLQSELASRIMQALQAQLNEEEDARESALPTADLEAYRQYSIGRAFLVERSGEALRGAIEHFERAVERDPEYALAWAGLGNALVMLVDYRHSDSDALLRRAETAARKAIALDPELAEGYSAFGNLHSARRECRKALEAHERAIALRPNYSGAHQWRCWVSLLIGDSETAVEAGTRACRLDPLDPEAKGNLSAAHLGCGDDEEAYRVGREALDQHPGFDWARWGVALALIHLGRHAEGRAAFERMTEPWASAWPETARGLDRVRTGDRERARAILEGHLASGATFHAGLLHAALGETDEAFTKIRSVLPLVWDEALYLRYYRGEPLTSMRLDPRWAHLMRDLDRGWGA